MSTADVRVPAEAEVALRVIRCGCGTPESHPNAICPTPRADHDLGTVAYTSNNPLKRLLWSIHGRVQAEHRIQEANRES